MFDKNLFLVKKLLVLFCELEASLVLIYTPKYEDILKPDGETLLYFKIDFCISINHSLKYLRRRV